MLGKKKKDDLVVVAQVSLPKDLEIEKDGMKYQIDMDAELNTPPIVEMMRKLAEAIVDARYQFAIDFLKKEGIPHDQIEPHV